MATKADVKKIALGLEGVSAVDHFGRPSYRTRKRIFAVMRPDGLFVHLPEERKAFLFEADPKTFVKFMWGKRSNVIVQIDRIGKPELERLMHEAWEFSKPAKAAKKVPSAKRPAAPGRKRARS